VTLELSSISAAGVKVPRSTAIARLKHFFTPILAAMLRRSFLKSCSALSLAPLAAFGNQQGAQQKFRLKYAPHPGMFKNLGGPDYLDEIRFAADQGFTAWEDNGVKNQTPEMQGKIGAELDRLGMVMGVFVAYGSFDRPTFARKDEAVWKEIEQTLVDSIAVAQRVRAKWMTVVPGSVDQQQKDDPKWNQYGGPRLSESHQTAHAIELLRRLSAQLEPHNLVMVLEPLNWQTNHGGVFLRGTDQAYALCKAVNSPSCKILFDLYHQQISAGNLIPSLDACWDEIAYIQSGDNPGRKEPGTGEVNYRNVLGHLAKKGYQGVIGMEHGNSRPGADGERAVIDAYRAVDTPAA
jgi:hydroxypyruvate isomerase